MKTKDARLTASQPAEEDAELARVLEAFFVDVEAQHAPNPNRLIAEHPAIADRLRACLSSLEFVTRATGETDLRSAVDTQSVIRGVLGDFQINREVGRGGMGIVYEAEQLSLGRVVALKVLPFAAILDQKQLQRFKNEAQAAAHLKHPHIVGVYSVGCERGVHYYAMEYVEGHSLAEMIQQLRAGTSQVKSRRIGEQNSTRETTHDKHKAVGKEEIIQRDNQEPNSSDVDTQPIAALTTDRSIQSDDFFRSVAQLGIHAGEALEHAHQMGVVHRDIKPSNLLVDSSGHLWITDFGLAMTQTDGHLTMTGEMLGTLRYMSPEQIEAKHGVLDHRTDVYSLGLTLYELLTLRPAFPGNSRQKLVRQISEDEPCRMQRLNGAIPKDLETIVLRATAKEPQGRYATAQALADDLQRFLDDKPIQAKRPSLVRRLGKWTRRHKSLTVAALVAVFLGLLATAGLAMRNAREVREAEQLANEAIVSALTAISAEDYALAEGTLREAQAHIAREPGADPELSDKIRRLRMELEQFQSLIELVDQPKHHHYRIGANREWVGLAREALARYSVLSDPQWTSRLEQSLLPPERRSDTRKAAYRLLVLLAYHERERFEEVGEEVAARQALDYLQKASSCHSPTRVCYYLRGKAHRLLGEDEAAQAADSLAEKTPATIALDHFIPGHVADDTAEAIRQYQAALRVEPDHYSSLYFLGKELSRLNRHEAALMAFLGCTAARPDDTMVHVNRIGIYLEMGQKDNLEAAAEVIARLSWRISDRGEGWSHLAEEYVKKEQYESALAASNRAIEILEGLEADSPRFRDRKAWAYCLRGYVYGQIGEADKAIRDSTNAMRFAPEQPLPYKNRAVAYINKGEYNLAIADCTEAIRLGPNLAGAYANRGMAYRKISEPDKAIADCSKAIELDPQLSNGYSNRASAYIDKGEYNLAIADCTEAIRLDPNFAHAYNNRGLAHQHKGDFFLAIADYSNAIRLDPKSAMAYSNRSYVYAGKGEYNLAIADCTEAIRLDPDYATPYYNRGRQFYRRGELDKALADLNKGIQLDSNCGAAFDDRGHVYLLQGELDKAIADHTKAIELDQNAAAYNNRALVYTDKGELDKALADLGKAIQLDPESPWFFAQRAMLHQDRGDVEKAVTDIRRAMELRPVAYASYVHALILLSDGNIDEYHRACATMLDQFGDTKIPEAAHYVAWTAALVPDAVEDPGRIVELAEMAVGAAPKNKRYVTALGAALCRAGQYEEAIQRLSTAATEYENRSDMRSRSGLAYTWFWLAIANERLGHHGEAEQWFEKATKLTERLMAEHENGTSRLSWSRRLTLKLLREEAAGLIGMKDEG